MKTNLFGKPLLLRVLAVMLAACLATAFCLALPARPAAAEEVQEETAPEGEAQDAEKTLSKEEAENIAVAQVNGARITLASLMDTMNRLGPPPPGMTVEEVKEKALERLILQELAYQRAQSRGLAIEKDRIDSTVANLKTNLGGEDAYRAFLEREGTTEEALRARINRALLIELVYTREVLEKITIPEEDLRAEYEKEKDKYLQPEKVRVVDVVIFADPDDAKARKKAKALLREIREDRGGDPWQLVLDGTFSVRDLEVKKELHPALYEAAQDLEVGELSGVIAASDSLHIIKLEEHSPERHFTFEEVRGNIEGRLRQDAKQEKFGKWEKELRKDAEIEILPAKQWNQAIEK